MRTLRLKLDHPGDLEHAAELLRNGGTVAFPTETVYGLGADALNDQAVAKIFFAKQRPSWDPLIVHVAEWSQVAQVAVVPSELAARVEALVAAFWPGPLTLLLPRSGAVPDAVTAGRALVGVRIPVHPVALDLLRRAEIPVAAPSANTFGHISPTTAAHVLSDLDGRIDAVLDGGATTVGVESTVLDPLTMVVYRPGAVTLEGIAEVCGVTATRYVAPASLMPPEALPAPGVGIRHYAPRARLVLTTGTPESLQEAVASGGTAREMGVLLPKGWALRGDVAVFPWGEWNNAAALAASLFAGLRELDERGVSVIFCPLPSAGGMNDAIRDRLMKAALPA